MLEAMTAADDLLTREDLDPAQITPPPLMARLKWAELSLRDRREPLFEAVRRDPAFQREGIELYDFDTLDNFIHLQELLDERAGAYLDGMPNRTMIDIGCANGELGLVFEDAGFAVALLDRSHVSEVPGSHIRQNAPLVASVLARIKGSGAVVVDEDVDVDFEPGRVVAAFSRAHPDRPLIDRFGLGVMVGVLYHVKNPYSVLEKLGQLCDHLIIGTWVADCLPDQETMVQDEQVVFLLADRQLAADPTNYWIFTRRSFHVLVERCGWEILAEHVVTNPAGGGGGGPRLLERVDRLRERLGGRPNQRGVSPPGDVRQRVFLFMRRADREPLG
jgi:tRNA (mo5U34)-methyltransferase